MKMTKHSVDEEAMRLKSFYNLSDDLQTTTCKVVNNPGINQYSQIIERIVPKDNVNKTRRYQNSRKRHGHVEVLQTK